jgi:uncharacterized membrane protein
MKMKKPSSSAKNQVSSLVENITKQNIEKIMCIQREAEANRTTGEKVADVFARSVGSWPFIIIQSGLLTAWVVANVTHLIKPWDPYPFILLNLALSFQAAYASPIIMMSQNRQSKLADERNHLALQIELLAEQEDTETLILLRRVCDHLGIDQKDVSTKGLEKTTSPSELNAEIKRAEGHKPGSK